MYILYSNAEWDERKSFSNLAKHGVDFTDAVKIFAGWVLVSEERRRDYGENRFSALGETDNQILRVVYTRRGDSLRVISARRAGRYERKAYYESLDARS